MQKRFDTRYIMDILETKFRCAIYGGLMLLKVRICMAVSRGSIFRSSLSLSLRFTVHFQPFQKCIPSPILASMHACMHARTRVRVFKIKRAAWMPGGRETSICKNNAIRTLIFLNLRANPSLLSSSWRVFSSNLFRVERLLAVKKKKKKLSASIKSPPV